MKLKPIHIHQAQQRRLALVRWQSHLQRLAQTPVRSDAERLAKHQALALMEQARP
jgi:hypothetical protein